MVSLFGFGIPFRWPHTTTQPLEGIELARLVGVNHAVVRDLYHSTAAMFPGTLGAWPLS